MLLLLLLLMLLVLLLLHRRRRGGVVFEGGVGEGGASRVTSRLSPDEDRGEFDSTWTVEADGSLTDGTAADGSGPFEAAVGAERRCLPFLLTFSIANSCFKEIMSE